MARILVVDDEHNIRLMIRLALQHVGYDVETAFDGPDGLLKFGSGADWDLVLLDQRMPGMEGLDVLREMRRRDPNVRIIMITAFGTVDLAVNTMNAGATDFLRKPFTADILRGAVKCAIDGPVYAASDGPITFGRATLNGFRIESMPKTVDMANSALEFYFLLRSPTGEAATCQVRLTANVVELVKTRAEIDITAVGSRFWQAFAEESLANYVWQHADFPPGNHVCVEELTLNLKAWIDAVPTAVN